MLSLSVRASAAAATVCVFEEYSLIAQLESWEILPLVLLISYPLYFVPQMLQGMYWMLNMMITGMEMGVAG